jgi:hypothetical protein
LIKKKVQIKHVEENHRTVKDTLCVDAVTYKITSYHLFGIKIREKTEILRKETLIK